ncbi:patatin-like phospholipase family protein [Rhizobium sp. LjRoot98]|uniref:patatin-like phospholipase family protein n=1 Tax=Rhizobium sp. LjRoot98 TaxID=3342345 RepID=UPI003ECF14E7
MSNEIKLPDFSAEQFRLQASPPECDMIMKGGITSGIVYPYAVLQIATKFRLRSLGGTSAGAIAAAFAAAAEYGRQNRRPQAFLVLKSYCDELPDRLRTLFQASPQLSETMSLVEKVSTNGIPALTRPIATSAVCGAVAGALILAALSFWLKPDTYASSIAGVLGILVGGLAGVAYKAHQTVVRPLLKAWRGLPSNDYGFCTGLKQPGHEEPALTDWMHRAIQDIAFGDPDHKKPLTFGDLRGPDPRSPIINLRVVTTNLSMRRPHTLPKLGVRAGFFPAKWDKLFPEPVMRYLYGGGSRPWRRHKNAWVFPSENDLPVVVAVRMSLSFPVLFATVPLQVEDQELPSIVKSLGGKPYKRIRTALFSDGGISSNFPIHMFDAPLPTRPTFAFSLEEILWNENELTTRVALPRTASEGMGVQIKVIQSFGDFAWQVLNSAKDWQDQLLSEITGQRERVARIFLTKKEGGLNLSMTPSVSRQLMAWGYEAGRKFTDGEFDFEEHKWRRFLAMYGRLEGYLDATEKIWTENFQKWYSAYANNAKTYKRLTKTDRATMLHEMEAIVSAARSKSFIIPDREEKLPKRSGVLKIGTDF